MTLQERALEFIGIGDTFTAKVNHDFIILILIVGIIMMASMGLGILIAEYEMRKNS